MSTQKFCLTTLNLYLTWRVVRPVKIPFHGPWIGGCFWPQLPILICLGILSPEYKIPSIKSHKFWCSLRCTHLGISKKSNFLWSESSMCTAKQRHSIAISGSSKWLIQLLLPKPMTAALKRNISCRCHFNSSHHRLICSDCNWFLALSLGEPHATSKHKGVCVCVCVCAHADVADHEVNLLEAWPKCQIYPNLSHETPGHFRMAMQGQ